MAPFVPPYTKIEVLHIQLVLVDGSRIHTDLNGRGKPFYFIIYQTPPKNRATSSQFAARRGYGVVTDGTTIRYMREKLCLDTLDDFQTIQNMGWKDLLQFMLDSGATSCQCEACPDPNQIRAAIRDFVRQLAV
jgi:hypothetical protein